MATGIPPGRPGNLTAEQEENLRKLWSLIFQLCRVGESDSGNVTDGLGPVAGSQVPEVAKAPEGAKDESPKKKKKRASLFGRRRVGSEVEAPAPAPGLDAALRDDAQDDKYGQTKQFFDTLASQSPESIRSTLWSMVKHDDPDALVLRFLRARKWDVQNALVMLIATMNWRATEMHVDDDIMKNGEGGAALAEAGNDLEEKRMGHDFLAQMRMGKSFLHGSDKEGRPICFVRVRLHRQGEHLEKALERNTVYVIETARLLLNPPVDTATIIFDMTGFSMANMDYTPVKFMVRCFEANYPESLGAILVYKAPWIFQGIWKVIRGWLDPVVASKVHFLNTPKEMDEFVDLEKLPKEVDGNANWEYRYVEPIEGENARMSDVGTRDRLVEAREKLVEEYEQATLEWVKGSDAEKTAAVKEKRNAIAAKLRESYWSLDPYLRARSLLDRVGMIKPGGEIDLYADEKATEVNGKLSTFDDDVD